MKVTQGVLVTLLVALFATGAAQIELEYWTHEDPNRSQIEERLIEEFVQLHPNVRINRVTHPSGPLPDLILTAFAANRAPDIFGLTSQRLTPYIVHGRVAPVNTEVFGVTSHSEIIARYAEGALDPVVHDGQLYGIPFEVTNWAIFMNDRIFRDAGLDPDTDYPTTWEEMMEVSDQIAIREGDVLVRRGFDFRYPFYNYFVVPMVEQLGGSLIDEETGDVVVGDEAWLRVLSYFQEWGPHGRNLGSPTYTNARALFNHDNNDLAMAHTGLYQIARIRADNQEFYDSGEWRVVPFPRWADAVNDVAAVFYGMYWLVNEQASVERQEMAWRFVDYMASHPLEYFEVAGLVQPVPELLGHPAYQEYPYTEVFDQELARGNPLYSGEHAARVQEALQDAIEAVMLQNASPENVLPTLRDSVQRALEGRF